MLSNIGVPGLVLILVFALVLFGPKRLPELGRSMGKTLREFKSATSGMLSEEPAAAKVVGSSTDTEPKA